MLGFSIWFLMGALIIGLGIYDMKSSKEVAFGFWANVATPPPMKDVKAYNKAVGKLFLVFGIIFILLGLPMLAEKGSPYIVITIVGPMLLAIVTMGIYAVKIEGKYRK